MIGLAAVILVASLGFMILGAILRAMLSSTPGRGYIWFALMMAIAIIGTIWWANLIGRDL